MPHAVIAKIRDIKSALTGSSEVFDIVLGIFIVKHVPLNGFAA